MAVRHSGSAIAASLARAELGLFDMNAGAAAALGGRLARYYSALEVSTTRTIRPVST
jgi:shikimate dehydrogenase